VTILAGKSDDIQAEGGLSRMIEARCITRIHLDEKVYVAMDKERSILSGLSISDDQIARFFLLAHPDMDIHSQPLRQMAKNPGELRRAFEAGFSKLMSQKKQLTDIQFTDNLHGMLAMLDKITGGLEPHDRDILSRHIGDAIFSTDPSAAAQLTSQNMEHLLGGLLLQYLMTKLTKDQATGPRSETDDQRPAGLSSQNDPQEDSRTRLRQVADKFSLYLQEARTLMDKDLMSALPAIIEQLIAQKEQEALETMLFSLTANLAHPDPVIRTGAARGLADIIDVLTGERKSGLLEQIKDKLTDWLKSENHFSPEYTRFCTIFEQEIQADIGREKLDGALYYLETIDQIASAADRPNHDTQEAARNVIVSLATEDNLKALWKQYPEGDENIQTGVKEILARLGDPALQYLLDLLRTQTDSNERVSIMHVIMNAKQSALPLIRMRLGNEEPWYYLRNLTYMLGQIGNEESAGALQPFLRHENERLRQEVLKTIQKTGGSRRGAILLPALNSADEVFKQALVEALGASKAENAVPDMLSILKDRPLIASAARTTLEESICTALGAIGSPDAIPALSEIAENKSFFGLRSYPEKVKAAAAGSLVTLRRKIAQSADA
ncbi:MAG: HEAT repeat domain-containing protein, partial [Smithellaceae bacterium]